LITNDLACILQASGNRNILRTGCRVTTIGKVNGKGDGYYGCIKAKKGIYPTNYLIPPKIPPFFDGLCCIIADIIGQAKRKSP